jgi:hypothetical protein
MVMFHSYGAVYQAGYPSEKKGIYWISHDQCGFPMISPLDCETFTMTISPLWMGNQQWELTINKRGIFTGKTW